MGLGVGDTGWPCSLFSTLEKTEVRCVSGLSLYLLASLLACFLLKVALDTIFSPDVSVGDQGLVVWVEIQDHVRRRLLIEKLDLQRQDLNSNPQDIELPLQLI